MAATLHQAPMFMHVKEVHLPLPQSRLNLGESSVWFIIPFFLFKMDLKYLLISEVSIANIHSVLLEMGKFHLKTKLLNFLTIGIWEASLVGSGKGPLVMELILVYACGALSRAFVGEGAAEALPARSEPLGSSSPPVALGEHSHFLFFHSDSFGFFIV